MFPGDATGGPQIPIIDNSQEGVNCQCRHCSTKFFVSPYQLSFLKKVGPVFDKQKFEFPIPDLCPNCRRQLRHYLRNQLRVYKRKCDLSGRDILSTHNPEAPFPVFYHELWWEKKRRGLEFGRDFDFTRGFFEQMQELRNEVPIESLRIVNCENSEFCSNVSKLKNCVLLIGSFECEDCFYMEACSKSRNTMLAWRSQLLDLCYHIYGSTKLFHSFYCELCTNGNDLWFCKECVDCSHCFGCSQLRHKKYHIFNQPYSKQAYLDFMKRFNSGSHEVIKAQRDKAWKFWESVPVPPFVGSLNINSSGDNIWECKNCSVTFLSRGCEDCKYVFESVSVMRSQDIDNVRGASGLCFQSNHSTTLFHVCFSTNCHSCSDSFYLSDCYELKHCFACIGLYNEHHCILNKRYSAEEYQKLASKIARHMIETGEWGRQFPPAFSRYAYNQTTANVHYGRDKEAAVAEGFRWSDYKEPIPDIPGIINAADLPDNIDDVDDSILKTPIICEDSGKLYRIQKKELALLRKLKIPLPRRYYISQLKPVRHGRNLAHFYKRNCPSIIEDDGQVRECGEEFYTTYTPQSNQIVVCEDCYHEIIFG